MGRICNPITGIIDLHAQMIDDQGCRGLILPVMQESWILALAIMIAGSAEGAIIHELNPILEEGPGFGVLQIQANATGCRFCHGFRFIPALANVLKNGIIAALSTIETGLEEIISMLLDICKEWSRILDGPDGSIQPKNLCESFLNCLVDCMYLECIWAQLMGWASQGKGPEED